MHGPPDELKRNSHPFDPMTDPPAGQREAEAMARPEDEEGQPSEAANGARRDGAKNTNGSGSADEDHQDAPPAEEKKPSWLKRAVEKLGLDAPTVMTMFK